MSAPALAKRKELTDGYMVDYGLTASSATRVFVDDPDSGTNIAVPWIGDAFPETDLSKVPMYVDHVRKTKFGGMPNLHRYEVTYSTRPTGGSGGPNGSSKSGADQLIKGYQVGGEVISIASKDNGFFWVADPLGKVDPFIDTPVNQKIGKHIGTGSFSIERKTDRDTFPLLKLQALVGKINQDTFEGLPEETVLFEGASGSQYFNEEGKIRFKVSMSFRYRENSWNHLYREDTGEFQLVATADLTTLYETEDLNVLISPEFF